MSDYVSPEMKHLGRQVIKAEDMDTLYKAAEDPWEFKTRHQERYGKIIQAIKDRQTRLKDEHLALATECFECPSKIIDIGCAEGHFTRELAHAFPHSLIVGVDVSKTAIERARDPHNARVMFFTQDIQQQNLSTLLTADVIVAGDVMYYIHPPNIPFVVKNVVDALNPGGILILTEFVRTRKYSKCYENVLKRITEERASSTVGGGLTGTYRFAIYQKELPCS